MKLLRGLFIILLLHLLLLTAQSVIELRDGMPVGNVGLQMEVLEDKTASLTFEEVSSPQYGSLFRKSKDEVVNFNVSKSVFWCRLRLQNVSSASDWCVQESSPAVKSVTCYVISGNTTRHYFSGLLLPLEKRTLPLINSTFPLEIPKDSSCIVYLRLEDNAPFQANIRIGKFTGFVADAHRSDIVNGLYYGIMLFMMLYNLFLFFSFRERSYIYYVFYVMCTSVFMSFLTGYIVHFPEAVKAFTSKYPSVSPSMFGLSALLFTANFLDIRKHSRLLMKGFYITISCVSGAVLVGFFGMAHEAVIFVQLMGFFMCAFAILCGVVVLRKGYRPAKFYLLAWTLYMIGLVIYILTDFGVLPFNAYTHGSFQVGSVLEAALLSFALADKVSGLREDKKKAQEAALQAAQENERIVREQNVLLEQKVEERTQEIRLQKAIIEEKNKDILDSIHYAKRIQRALLASDKLLQKNLGDYFVLYRPKDIVSGDFYWGHEIGANKFLLLTGDCTGHGVPGAFMSLLNMSILHEITSGMKITRPDEILNVQRDAIIMSLNPEGADEVSRDGMDCSLCVFDPANRKLEFACANNPVWLLRNGEMLDFRPDKFPVGIHEGEQKKFTLQQVDLQPGDIVYTLTDGFADQFGGPKGKKFKYSRLKEQLLLLHTLPMKEQQIRLAKIFDEWKGEYEQLDDVLLIGIRIS